MTEERLKCVEDRLSALEGKMDQVIEMVSVGKHLLALGKLVGWAMGLYVALDTWWKTIGHK